MYNQSYLVAMTQNKCSKVDKKCFFLKNAKTTRETCRKVFILYMTKVEKNKKIVRQENLPKKNFEQGKICAL